MTNSALSYIQGPILLAETEKQAGSSISALSYLYGEELELQDKEAGWKGPALAALLAAGGTGAATQAKPVADWMAKNAPGTRQAAVELRVDQPDVRKRIMNEVQKEKENILQQGREEGATLKGMWEYGVKPDLKAAKEAIPTAGEAGSAVGEAVKDTKGYFQRAGESILGFGQAAKKKLSEAKKGVEQSAAEFRDEYKKSQK